MTAPVGGERTYTCTWCGAVSDASSGSCPRCGAPVDIRLASTNSGWYELPAIKDMARIQFGQSSCQIEGTYVPVADMNLAPGDGVYFGHHEMLWKDERVVLGALPMRGGYKRALAGLPVIMSTAQGPGHIAFSKDAAGEMIALPLNPGMVVDVREHVFLVATDAIVFDYFDPGVWFRTQSGDETETHRPLGMYMDRFGAQQRPGLLLLHCHGNAFIRQLQPGQSILVKPAAMLFKDSSVGMHLHLEYPATRGWASWRAWAHRHVWLRLIGPGRVAVQSAYEHFEDSGNRLQNHSPATQQNW